MRFLYDDKRASAIRTLIRATVVIFTAFGLDLDANQVAAIQLMTEAVMQAARAWFGGEE